MCEEARQGTARPTTLIDNSRTRVTEWQFDNYGDNTGWHRHEHDYIVIPMQDGALDIVGPDGTVARSELRKGIPYFREAGVEHDVLNGNAHTFAFVEVELIEPAQGRLRWQVLGPNHSPN